MIFRDILLMRWGSTGREGLFPKGTLLPTLRRRRPDGERFSQATPHQCSCFAPSAHPSPQNLLALHLIYQLLTRLILLPLPGSLRDERLQRRTVAALIRSAAFSPIMIVAALVFPFTMVGIIEASTTRRPAVPRTRNCSSTTARAS